MQVLPFQQNKSGLKSNTVKGSLQYCFLILLCMACLFFSSLAEAKSLATSKLIDYLFQEKNNLTLAINETKSSILPSSLLEYLKQSEQNTALRALNTAKMVNLESFLVTQKKIQQDYLQRLKYLQQTPLSLMQVNPQERIGKLNVLNESNKKTINLIIENLALVKRYQELLTLQKQQLDLWKANEQRDKQLERLRAQSTRLHESLARLYENSLKLQQTTKAENGFENSYANEAKLLLNNQIITLTQYKIAEIDLQKKLVKADFLLEKNLDLRTLQSITETYKEAIIQLADMEESLKKIVSMLIVEQSQLKDNVLKQQFTTLLRVVNSRIEGIAIQQQTLQEDLENHQQELKNQLSVRQSLSDYGFNSWPLIIEQITGVLPQLYNYLKSLTFKVKDNYFWQDFLPAACIWLSLLLITFAAYSLNKLLKRLTQDKERSRFSGRLYDGVLILLSRNVLYLALVTILVTILYLNHISYSNYQLLVNFIFVWFSFRLLILIARLILLERLSDSSGTDVKLYYRIKWLLLAGGWTTALMVISHQLPLSLLLQDIFNRLFMLFLLAVSLVGWKSREVIRDLLRPMLKTKKRYLRNAAMLLVVLIPLTLFTTAILGLVGYINLAWTMSRYQVEIIIIMTAYVLVRGLLFDALELLSEWMITALNNGWLWIEVLLKPLDKILRVLLFIFSSFLLFQLFGWQSDSAVITTMKKLGEHPLVNVSGIYITPISFLEFLILLSVFGWAAKWTREFCYRWLYRDARDAGIRNSLSVFTQYAVILIGGFITLRVLGLDFSGMSMILGGLAVGMGFGLRDFASNIVGGIMLLIERPVREGDLITLGTYEGRVDHIGIRSMRVCSWDNTEVLIPNAETFNKPFTNWTHQDSIVRTVVPIKVSRADDPAMIQQLMMDVLLATPEIEKEPPPQVFLKQIDDALIEFEVRYFINVQIHTRFEIRSKVLFAITAQFKAAGVQAPIPPISIELKEGMREPIVSKKSTE